MSPEVEEHQIHDFKIIVNGREKIVTTEALTFDQIIELAFPGGDHGADTAYSVTYTQGHADKHQGTLVEGESIKTKDGLIFNVTKTGRS